jgi:hypothetical protein
VHIVMLAAVYLVQEVTPAHKGQLGGDTQLLGLYSQAHDHTGTAAFTNIQYLHRSFLGAFLCANIECPSHVRMQ